MIPTPSFPPRSSEDARQIGNKKPNFAHQRGSTYRSCALCPLSGAHSVGWKRIFVLFISILFSLLKIGFGKIAEPDFYLRSHLLRLGIVSVQCSERLEKEKGWLDETVKPEWGHCPVLPSQPGRWEYPQSSAAIKAKFKPSPLPTPLINS